MKPLVTFSYRTDIGLMRRQNEDNYHVPSGPEADPTMPMLFAVADGMGGHRGGKMASQLAVETLASSFASAPEALSREQRIVKAVQDANLKVFETSATVPEYFGMGTTLTSFAVFGAQAIVGHVGDSRLYHYRAGRLMQVTLDHSLVAQAEREGILTPEQARIHPQRNIITRALGTRSDIEVDTANIALEKDDLLMASSDGLHGLVEDDELKDLIDNSYDLERLADELVRAALDHGGNDNVTVVLVRFDGADA
ncbi:MAG: Stp1/IreP family PP2C-type Ser/Thr phosphatase [Candidatus Riflebacteria bacterium]|nr:Stp1/IreP family PP2C-type Ser/Thr phosphatase [Candidatus Riflebacteria bacterium]